jgi:hypothetical protein
MTYTKPEVHEIGAAAEMIQGSIGGIGDNAGLLPPYLTLEDIEE